ncbi:MAG: TetR/AcrR family transcriptional regulator [Sulfurospirillaceae bacterium]|nr:TetR/AcrR family transcriptional regulator [Sulfurospirillaceae bacterium]
MEKAVKKRDSEASKKLILECAIKLFSKKGFNLSSMDELANMSGLNKAMIFYYFKNKQGLYEAVMETVIDEIYITVQKENQNYKNPMEELKNFIKTYAFFASNNPHLPALLLKELSNSGSVMSENLFYKMRKLFALFSDILDRGKKDGSFNDIVPMVLYFMIIGTINLVITTKPLRIKALEIDNIDTCANCDIAEISDYLIRKITKMLKD